jgi:hypothetical protein
LPPGIGPTGTRKISVVPSAGVPDRIDRLRQKGAGGSGEQQRKRAAVADSLPGGFGLFELQRHYSSRRWH